MTRQQVWARHQKSGEIYAIDHDGEQIVGINGPLYYKDIWDHSPEEFDFVDTLCDVPLIRLHLLQH